MVNKNYRFKSLNTNGFQKGHPGYKAKKKKEVTALAKTESVEAFLRIVEIAKDQMVDVKTRFYANQYIIDRAIGKPRQAVEVGGEDGSPLQVSVVVVTKEGNK